MFLLKNFFQNTRSFFISFIKFSFKPCYSILSLGIRTSATVTHAITAPNTSIAIIAFNFQTEYKNAAAAGLSI
jgi:hypothetical protein